MYVETVFSLKAHSDKSSECAFCVSTLAETHLRCVFFFRTTQIRGRRMEKSNLQVKKSFCRMEKSNLQVKKSFCRVEMSNLQVKKSFCRMEMS